MFKSPTPQYIPPPTAADAPPAPPNPPMLGQTSEGKKVNRQPTQTVLGGAALSDSASIGQKSLLGQ